jgi:hypothetical protein
MSSIFETLADVQRVAERMTARTATATATTIQIVPFGSRSISTTATANPAAMRILAAKIVAVRDRRALMPWPYPSTLVIAAMTRVMSALSAVASETTSGSTWWAHGRQMRRSTPKRTTDRVPTAAARWLMPESFPT